MVSEFFNLNPFESPFLLMIAALVAIVVVHFIKDSLKGPAAVLVFIMPFIILALSVGLDRFVLTDNEAITSIIYNIRSCFIEQRTDDIARYVSDDFSARGSRSKQHLMEDIAYASKKVEAEKISINHVDNTINEPEAEIKANVTIHANGSFEGIDFAGIMIVDCEAKMRKTNGRWLITSASVTKINNSPVSF
ncbi:hypothetical protein SMSP2_01728 [Limihaloglobus sulfuriphilus]|uniref:Uncharacterized protein n=1 Tax=Limihaloglobus sulfuriphilus TaxID=1851148 RepID=A0A1Q2MF73_9BACT|nr:hypothetical protein [Limihaloglobus sulfuriphilus]AQQ71355.1 hypothetical protein SMSP2_01728 [Limihaloglobus sulfuriphilus]